MEQFGLEFVQTALSALLVRSVVHGANEDTLFAQTPLAHGQIHWEGGAVFPPPGHFAADAYDAFLASDSVMREVTVVLLVIRRRHEHFDVLPDDLGTHMAK